MSESLLFGAVLTTDQRKVDEDIKIVVNASYPFDSLQISFEAVSGFNPLWPMCCGQQISVRSFDLRFSGVLIKFNTLEKSEAIMEYLRLMVFHSTEIGHSQSAYRLPAGVQSPESYNILSTREACMLSVIYP